MSQMENMAGPAEGNMSKEELLELKKAMNAKALAKRRTRTALRVTANVVFAVLILLPLLYAISIALMPSSELFTTELNLFPKNPTFSNFINAFRTVPLHIEFLYHGGMHYHRTDHYLFSCCFCVFFPGIQRKRYSLHGCDGNHDGSRRGNDHFQLPDGIKLGNAGYLSGTDRALPYIRNGNFPVPSVLHDFPDLTV